MRDTTDRNPGQCGNCRYFRNDPADLERLLPGLTSLSSGYGSVRSNDGICLRHDRYLRAEASCPSFAPAQPSDVSEGREVHQAGPRFDIGVGWSARGEPALMRGSSCGAFEHCVQPALSVIVVAKIRAWIFGQKLKPRSR